MVAIYMIMFYTLSLLLGDVFSDNDTVQLPNDSSLRNLISIGFPTRDVAWFLDGVLKLSLNEFDSLTDEEVEAVQDFIEEFQLQTIISLIKNNNDTSQQQSNALIAGEELLKEREDLNDIIKASNTTFDQDDPTLKHQLAFNRTHPISTTMAKLGIITEGATLNFSRAFGIPNVSRFALSLLGPIPDCEARHADLLRPLLVECDNKYRTIDGSCNNVNHRFWGAAFERYQRLLPANYADGVSTFRKSVTGKTLPSARVVSFKINNNTSERSPSFSILQMTFGQFIDHDIAATPIVRGSLEGYPPDEAPVKCCPLDPPPLNKECAGILIPHDDPFYKRFNQTCMEFVRSAPAGNCHEGSRNQINQQTAYIDASAVYGVTPRQEKEIRTFEDGLLKGQVIEGNEFLLPPDMNHPKDGCNRKENMELGEYCFRAGDGRVNEQIQLTFLQTLWAREHNRTAKILLQLNPSWRDEKLFQEARRIVGAELQQVVYNEFLPTILSPALMDFLNLNPQTGKQQTDDYNDTENSALANSFAAAAYRMGHSLVADNLLYINKQGQVTPNELSTLFFNPFELYRRGAMCDIARGGLALARLKMDPYFTLEVAGKLFRGPHPFGLDLVALNIQRGRDHGLQPYIEWRKECGRPKAKTFAELYPDINEERIKALEDAYENVGDIDLYAGGVSETAVPGGLLGHTFTCIIALQFDRAKRGDRYWFEYKNGPGAFKEDQIQQLHNVTLARIMCNNLPGLEAVQFNPFTNLDPENRKVMCKCIPQYNLNPWEEKKEEEDDHDEL